MIKKKDMASPKLKAIKKITESPSQTKKIGEKLAKKILKETLAGKKTAVLGLIGDLGSGKTTFLQGFAKGLGIREKILSPSFVIMKKFPISPSQTFYHFDCYRINREKEILDLGFEEIVNNPQNIVAIEWSEKIKKIMPKKTIWIKFKFIKKNIRTIRI